MSDPRPKELIYAEELMSNGKIEEALEIVENFEKGSDITPKNQLSAMFLKGGLYNLTHQYRKTSEIGELAYVMSQELGLVPESIEALLLKAMARFNRAREAFNLILEAENLLNSISEESPEKRANLKYTKSWVYVTSSDYDKALDLAKEALTQWENLKNNVMIGNSLFLVGYIYYVSGDFDTALDYILKSTKLFENLGFQVGIANNFCIIGEMYHNMGDLNRALEFSNKALSIERISNYSENLAISVLGRMYQSKGELDKALMNFKSINIAGVNYTSLVKLISIGEIYRIRGEYDLAKNYFDQSLLVCEKMGNIVLDLGPNFSLFLISLDNNSLEKAQLYLKRLENLHKQQENEFTKQVYLLGKALILKASSRMHDHVDAERLLNQIVEENFFFPPYYIIAIISLSDLLLEELSTYNNPEVLDDLNPLIVKLIYTAEEQHSYSWLAEGKLLQAKLALIQMDFDKSKILLTQAQQIAQEHGLILLAQKISSEHDLLLEKVDEWERFKKEDAPMADRIELASFDGIINRIHGKQALDPPELIEEEPILLLIMDNSGATYFSHPFIANWDYNDLFSSFLSAFNAFSSEIFSKSIDRIKIDENTILINPVDPFLACYIIKGQSYPALQKLSRFTEAIKENSEIWQALNKAVKTSEMLELDKPPALKTVIDEIFT
ncbi:MAG: tetratricopeptide repeat protein [Promethearchaeota archaeon]|jgi:tetratricopeptide (TPR) repeat protein